MRIYKTGEEVWVIRKRDNAYIAKSFIVLESDILSGLGHRIVDKKGARVPLADVEGFYSSKETCELAILSLKRIKAWASLSMRMETEQIKLPTSEELR